MINRILAYGAGNLLTACIPFLLLPFLTNYLAPSELGVVAFIEALIMLILPLVIFGIDGSYSAFYQKLSKSDRASQSVALLQISLIMAFLLIPVFFVIIWLNLIPIDLEWYWIFSLILVFFSTAINSLFFSQLQMSGKASQYAILKTSIALLGALLTIYAILYIENSAKSRLLGIYASPIIASFATLLIMYKREIFSFDLDRPDMRLKGWKFGFGMVLHSWSAIIFFAADRFIIGYMNDPEALGKYAVAVQVGMVMSVIQNTFSQVWTPSSFELFANGKLKEFSAKSHLSILFLSIISIIVAMSIPLIYEWFIDSRYHELMDVSYWVVGTYFFLGLYKVFVVKLFYFERTALLAKITMFSSASNVILTVILLKIIGILGAAIATFLSSVLFFFLVFYFSKSVCFDSTDLN